MPEMPYFDRLIFQHKGYHLRVDVLTPQWPEQVLDDFGRPDFEPHENCIDRQTGRFLGQPTESIWFLSAAHVLGLDEQMRLFDDLFAPTVTITDFYFLAWAAQQETMTWQPVAAQGGWLFYGQQYEVLAINLPPEPDVDPDLRYWLPEGFGQGNKPKNQRSYWWAEMQYLRRRQQMKTYGIQRPAPRALSVLQAIEDYLLAQAFRRGDWQPIGLQVTLVVEGEDVSSTELWDLRMYENVNPWRTYRPLMLALAEEAIEAYENRLR